MRRVWFMLAVMLALGCFTASVVFAEEIATSKKWELNGDVELIYVDAEEDSTESDAHMDLDNVGLYPTVYLADDVIAYAEFYGGLWGAEVDVATLTLKDIFANSDLKVGLDSRFCAVSRKTKRHPFTSNMLWRNEVQQIELKSKFDPMYAVVSVGQGNRLANRNISISGGSAMIGDRYMTSDYRGVSEVGLGLGYDGEMGADMKLGVLGFGYVGRINDSDVAYLQTNLLNYTSNKDDQRRYGLNLKGSWKDIGALVQYVDAQDGDLDRSAWFAQASYKFELPMEKFKVHELIARYGELEVDTTKAVLLPATWDREDITLAFHSTIVDGVKLRTEYTWSDETTGGLEIDNNEFVMDLLITF